jgi:hypothetical protein
MDMKSVLNALHAERQRIDKVISAIEQLTSKSHGTWTGGGRKSNAPGVRRVRRRISAAGRKRLSELLKKRWASGKMGKKKRAKAA